MRNGGVLILLCVAIAGCAPSSQRLMEGSFTVEGAPRAGVQVWISTHLDARDCRDDGELVAVTDAAGSFKVVVPDKAFRPCFVVDGRSYATFIMLRASPGDRPEKPLRCGLPLVHTGHFEDGQICY